jgi:hypothetical protein
VVVESTSLDKALVLTAVPAVVVLVMAHLLAEAARLTKVMEEVPERAQTFQAVAAEVLRP